MKKKYQGTVKENRVHLQSLRGEFEALRMQNGELGTNYFSRTLSIANKM